MTVHVGKESMTKDENLDYELPAGSKETSRNNAWILNLKDCLNDIQQEKTS